MVEKISTQEIAIKKSMVNMYDMPEFAVDCVKSYYPESDIFEICKITNDLFDLNLKVQDVIHFLNPQSFNPVTQDFRLSLHDVFNKTQL